jgi:hypothetical protein
LRLAQAAQPLDATAARFFRLVPQVGFEGVAQLGAQMRFEPLEILDGLRGQDNGERHYGQMIARILVASNASRKRETTTARASHRPLPWDRDDNL